MFRFTIRDVLWLMVVVIIVVSCLVVIQHSDVPKRVMELAGRLIVKKIMRNPGGTAVISLTACGTLWLAIGLLSAGQEWLEARRRIRPLESGNAIHHS
jgi:hypothetical protein